MTKGFYFNGRQYTSPTVVSAIDETAMAATAVALSNNLAIIADVNHGQPNTVLTFTSASQAEGVLVDGDALAGIRKAFDASAETGGPAQIMFVRVGQATQSVATLADLAGNVAMNLQTTDYGIQSVGVQIKVAAGTAKGAKVTVKDNGVQYVGDNLYSAPVTIAYTGVGSSPRVQVNSGNVTLRVSGNVVATLPFVQFNTVQSLVDAINAVVGFTAIAGAGTAGFATAALFDNTNNIDIIAGGVDLTAINFAIANWINSSAELAINAQPVYGFGALAVTPNWVVLQGGVSPAVTNLDWSNAFDLLQAEDVQWIVPISSAPSIHAMASAHVDYMSTVGRSERRAILGMALGTTDTQAIAEAPTLNDDRVSLVHIGVWDFNSAGVLTLYAPYVLAAQCAGALAGSAPGIALTNKSLKCQGFERKLKSPTDTDALIRGGVMPFHTTRRGFICTMSVSTWLANDNINRVQVNTGTALDYTVRALRDALEVEIGHNGSAMLLGDVISKAETVLKQLSKAPPIGQGILVGDDVNPPFRNLTATITQDAIIFECEVSPVIAINYIGIVVHAVPYSGTATA